VKVEENGHLKAKIRPLPLPDDASHEIEALTLSVTEMASKFVSLVQGQPEQDVARMFAAQQSDPLQLAFMVASLMNVDGVREQALLETTSRLDGLRLVMGWLSHEVNVAELRNKITEDARTEMSKDQREYLLRQQKRAIEQELGEKNSDQAETENLREKLAKADLPEDIRKEAERELGRLEKVNTASPEHNVIRTWLEYVIELPWNKRSEDSLDLKRAREILDEDHYGIVKVKERIIEQLAVLKLNPEAKAPILCFVGAPGVGKTSLGQSIARALGRKFERMSLGGLHDEAELRGHRRTYIGALPGRLIQAMRRAGFSNPVLMLDEVDKLGRDFRGDPASALLEVLDPEQNKSFRDNYLDLPFDLSKVLFITTANTLDTIPAPLLDRMEILALSGYSEEEDANRAAVPAAPAVEAHRVDCGTVRDRRGSFAEDDPLVYARGGRAAAGTGAGARDPQGRGEVRRRAYGTVHRGCRRGARVAGAGGDSAGAGAQGHASGRGHGSGLDRNRRRCVVHRSGAAA